MTDEETTAVPVTADDFVRAESDPCFSKMVPNCPPIEPGWNHTVRLHRPRAEVLDGTWSRPEALPVP